MFKTTFQDFVMPAQAGIHYNNSQNSWMPAYAGMTSSMHLGICLIFIITLLVPVAHCAEFKDPTQPPDVDLHTSKPTSSNDVLRRLNLHEIVTKGQDRWAVINNTIVREGDLILGERVVKIGKEQVTLKGETGEIQLHLINGKPIKEVSQ